MADKSLPKRERRTERASGAEAVVESGRGGTPTDPCTLFMSGILGIRGWGGAERSAVALANWLEARGVPHRFVLYYDTLGIEKRADHALEVVHLLPGPRSAARKVRALRRFFHSRRHERQAPLTWGYQPALHATLAGVRRFHTLMHDTPGLMGYAGTARQRLSNAIIGYGLRRAERLGGHTIVTSEYLRDECRRFFGVDAKIVRMGGMGRSAVRVRPVDRELRLLSVCRLERNKRIDWIVAALAELEHEELPLSATANWRLELVGTGTEREKLERMAVDGGIADRVVFHGFVSDEDLERLYSEAHLFLMPAVQGYGIPAIEALQRGIPVLLHRESGVSDILLDTPWATVLTAGAEQMTPKLREAIRGVVEGRHHHTAQPKLPTEEGWAEEMARLCGWVA